MIWHARFLARISIFGARALGVLFGDATYTYERHANVRHANVRHANVRHATLGKCRRKDLRTSYAREGT